MSKDQHIDILARTLYGESVPYNAEDAQAIASVVMNRVRMRNWPATVSEVCLQPYQFSCWNVSDPNRARIAKASGDWFDRCIEIAKAAVEKRLDDPTNQSTHYHTPRVTPKWSRNKKAVYQTAGHLFFNDIDTKPPENAKQALDQIKPVGETDTAKAVKVGTLGSVGVGALGKAVEQLEPAMPLAITMAEAAPWAIVAILAGVIVFILWSRNQARSEGKI